ncbi:MAG: hypothetical protein WDM87_12240 [Terracidiphilus sp.]
MRWATATPGEGSGQLSDDIGGRLAPGDSAQPCVGQRYGRVQMRSGDWAKGENDCDKRGARSKRIGEQGDRNIARREAFAHDSRADNRGKKKKRPNEFRDSAMQQAGLHERPSFSISL